MTLTEKVKRAIESSVPAAGGVGVAVSGGSDSMCLLDCLLRFCLLPRERLVVINVDHGIRGEESARDSAFVADYCKARGLALVSRFIDVPEAAAERGESLETAARLARRALFDELVKSDRVSVVMTAHNAYDRTESVLMHIFRGSGLGGLVGPTVRDGFIVRPLIDVTKPEIAAYVKEYGVSYVEDSTNADTVYTRNFLRREILPLVRSRYPGVDGAIARLGDSARKILEKSGKDFETQSDGSVILSADCAGEDVIAAFAAAGLKKDFSEAHIIAVKNLKEKNAGTGVDLPHGYRAEKETDGVRIFTPASAFECETAFGFGEHIFPQTSVTVEKCEVKVSKTETVFDSDKIPQGSVIRTRKDGDVFTPFGGKEKSLSDWLIDKKIPRYERSRLMYIAHGNDVLAVIGVATGEKIKIDKTTVAAAKATQKRLTGEGEKYDRQQNHADLYSGTDQ